MSGSLIRRVGAIAAALVMTGLSGCTQSGISDSVAATPDPVEHMAQVNPADVNPELVQANTRFGFKLFSQLWQENADENLFVSPLSVAIALTMAYNGATGEAQTAMAEALEIQGMSLEELNQASAELIAALESADPDVQLAIANSLWARQDVEFNADFLTRSQAFYQAEITNLDFLDPQAPRQINQWVRQNTQGKIEQIIDAIDPQEILFLINAIYFKGSWTEEFDPGQTRERPFHRLDGTAQPHPLMSQSGEYRYYETDQFQAVSLPYGTERFSFYVFLPEPELSLAEFQRALTADEWNTWMQQFRKRPGSIQLPRFRMEYETELNETLKTLGMGPAFEVTDEPRFTGISPDAAAISRVRHKTFVEVNEEGTEAAAVTSVGIVATSAALDPEPPFEMIVDRPFFCAIRDDQTGAVLFMGAITTVE